MLDAVRSALSELATARPGYLGAALGLYLVSILVGAARFHTFLLALGQPVRLSDVLGINAASIFVGNVTPVRIGGELFRVAMLRQRTGAETMATAAALGYDRLTDVIPLAVMGLLCLRWLGELLGQRRHQLVLWLGIALVVLLAAWLLARFVSRARDFLSSLRTLRVSRRAFVRGLGYSFLLWAMDLARLLLVAAAVSVPLAPVQAAPLSLLSAVGDLVSPGGVGVVEGGLTAALCLYGVPIQKAIAVAVVERAISYAFGTLLGGATLVGIGGVAVIRTLRRQRRAEAV